MNNQVKCKVEECVYYENGLCTAKDIEIMSSVSNLQVGTSEETCCSTFQSKLS